MKWHTFSTLFLTILTFYQLSNTFWDRQKLFISRVNRIMDRRGEEGHKVGSFCFVNNCFSERVLISIVGISVVGFGLCRDWLQVIVLSIRQRPHKYVVLWWAVLFPCSTTRCVVVPTQVFVRLTLPVRIFSSLTCWGKDTSSSCASYWIAPSDEKDTGVLKRHKNPVTSDYWNHLLQCPSFPVFPERPRYPLQT